jgi:hypothetical protein
LSASRYEGRWNRRTEGPLTLREALAFVRSRGVRVPRETQWRVAKHDGLTLREVGLEWNDERGRGGADAIYFRANPGTFYPHALVRWNRLQTLRGTIPIFVRAEVLRSEDHTLYVLSHELFELRELKSVFQKRGGSMTFRELADLVNPDIGGPIHQAAVQQADLLVQRFRAERGFDS